MEQKFFLVHEKKNRVVQFFCWLCIKIMPRLHYSVVSIKRTGSLNYFEVFSHPVLFFHVLKKIFLPPCSFFYVLKKIFAPPCSLITSCSLNRYYRVYNPDIRAILRKVIFQKAVSGPMYYSCTKWNFCSTLFAYYILFA